MIGVSSKVNTAGLENGSRMETTQLSGPLPSRGTWVGARGQERTGAPLCLSLPLPRCPPLLLHQYRKRSTDLHIFPNIHDLFFFPSVGGDRRESKKRSWSHARQARKQEGFHQGSCKHNTDKRTEIVLSPGPQFAALRSSETESSENGALRPTEAVNGGGAPLGLQPPPTPGHDVLRRGTWGEAQREERALPPP